MTEFILKGHDFIALNKLLKVLGWVGTGGEANMVIDNGEVKVNDVIEIQKRKKLRAGDSIFFAGQSIVVSE